MTEEHELQTLVTMMTIEKHLGRIAAALDRAVPAPVDRIHGEPAEPAGLDALTVVTPALRRKWLQEENDRRSADPTSQSPDLLIDRLVKARS
jgi:hypothetical protein